MLDAPAGWLKCPWNHKTAVANADAYYAWVIGVHLFSHSILSIMNLWMPVADRLKSGRFNLKVEGLNPTYLPCLQPAAGRKLHEYDAHWFSFFSKY